MTLPTRLRRTSPRKTVTPPVPAPRPERVVIPPAPDEPVWGELPSHLVRSYADFGTFTGYVRQQTDGKQTYTLPPFQREWSDKWDANRCCSYLNALLVGQPQPPIVLWYVDATDKTYLLDGQHRLVTIGARVVDSQGQARTPPAVCFDLVAGRWVPGESDATTTFTMEQLEAERWSYVKGRDMAWRSSVFIEAVVEALARMNEAELTFTAMRREENADSWQRALNYFERLHDSVAFTPDELNALRTFAMSLREST